MCVSTSRRRALIPSGSLTPSWPSTMKPRRSTWRTSRFEGIATARATSIARRMSSRLISRSCAVTATWPVELRLSTWAPPTPTKALSIFQPDSRSAFSTASLIDRTVWSMLTTAPFLRPGRRNGAVADHRHAAVAPDLTDERADLARADVDADEDPFDHGIACSLPVSRV